QLTEDWAFGLVDRDRQPTPALAEVAARYKGPLPPALPCYPRVSVVVCAYNAERTMEACLASLETLDYPDYEVIVVNDGSKDRTLEISQGFPYCRIISQEHKGLSVDRNVEAEAAGDDVDICWRFQDAGHTIGFSPAAIVWHFRRNTVKAYLNQQKGYGKAEALVYAKHPFRFNLFGQAKWLGRIYGDLSAALLLS